MRRRALFAGLLASGWALSIPAQTCDELHDLANRWDELATGLDARLEEELSEDEVAELDAAVGELRQTTSPYAEAFQGSGEPRLVLLGNQLRVTLEGLDIVEAPEDVVFAIDRVVDELDLIVEECDLRSGIAADEETAVPVARAHPPAAQLTLRVSRCRSAPVMADAHT